MNSLFDFYFDLGHELDVKDVFLYHYRSSESVQSIFTEDGLCFRMTRADCFPDKQEGRVIRDYYEESLSELLKEGNISIEKYEELKSIVIPEESLIVTSNEDEMNNAEMKECDVFILCFSTVKCDTYMFEHYGSRGKSKYCLQLSRNMIETQSHHDFTESVRSKLSRVLYGRDNVEYLKGLILDLLREKILRKNDTMLIADKLHELRYLAKSSDYKKENEVRFIVYVPKGNEVVRDHYIACENDETHLWLKLDQCTVCNYWPWEENNAEDDKAFAKLLKERGYDYLLDDQHGGRYSNFFPN